MKLTQDQKETLQAMDRDQWDAISAYCAVIIDDMARRVLTTEEPKKLIFEKRKYDGAIALAKALENARVQLKEKKNVRSLE